MTYQDLTVAREGAIAIVTINRPEKRNALRLQTFEDLYASFHALLTDESVRVVVLTGAGKAFCAGLDLKETPFRPDEDPEEMVSRVQGFLNWVEETGTPVVAALNGDALAGGCELALSCHFRVMDRAATMGLTELNVGVVPGAGGTQKLARALGVAKALDHLIFGKRIEAEDALRFGLVHKLADAGRAFEDAMELARAIAKRPPIAVKGAVKAVCAGANRGLEIGLAAEREALARTLVSADAVEGAMAFFEKREPQWQGR